jgi:hypothetical protein
MESGVNPKAKSKSAVSDMLQITEARSEILQFYDSKFRHRIESFLKSVDYQGKLTKRQILTMVKGALGVNPIPKEKEQVLQIQQKGVSFNNEGLSCFFYGCMQRLGITIIWKDPNPANCVIIKESSPEEERLFDHVSAIITEFMNRIAREQETLTSHRLQKAEEEKDEEADEGEFGKSSYVASAKIGEKVSKIKTLSLKNYLLRAGPKGTSVPAKVHRYICQQVLIRGMRKTKSFVDPMFHWVYRKDIKYNFEHISRDYGYLLRGVLDLLVKKILALGIDLTPYASVDAYVSDRVYQKYTIRKKGIGNVTKKVRVTTSCPDACNKSVWGQTDQFKKLVAAVDSFRIKKATLKTKYDSAEDIGEYDLIELKAAYQEYLGRRRQAIECARRSD